MTTQYQDQFSFQMKLLAIIPDSSVQCFHNKSSLFQIFSDLNMFEHSDRTTSATISVKTFDQRFNEILMVRFEAKPRAE